MASKKKATSKDETAKEGDASKANSEPKKKEGKNGEVSNGTIQKKTSSKWSLVECVLVALVSLLGGILTPPLLSLHQAHQTRRRWNSRVSIWREVETPRFLCNEETLSQYLHDIPVPGMHVVCLDPVEEHTTARLTLYPNAQRVGGPPAQIVTPQTWTAMRQTLVDFLKLTPTDALHQPWAIFSPIGERLLSELDQGHEIPGLLLGTGVVLVFQGGQFLWPGVRIGFRRQVELYSVMPPDSPAEYGTKSMNVTLETLSLQPLVHSVVGFLSDEECDYVQEKALPTMKYSGVSLMDKDKGRPASDFRTSQSTFLRNIREEMLLDIDYRTASLVRIPRSHQEDVQILRYGLGEKYDQHHDFFNPILYKNDPMTLRTIAHGRRNRLATVFWYLTDVPEGGETIFPRFNAAPAPLSHSDCTKGLKVKPERGKVIIFYSLTPDGELDPYSLHGACPVIEGVKWAGNKWVWNEAMGYLQP